MESADPSHPDPAAPVPPSVAQALAEAARCLLADLRGVAAQQLALLALEARKTLRDALAMAALGAATGVLLALAWAGLTVACGLWLVEQGVRTSLAVLLASALNALAALGTLRMLRQLWCAPQFSATRKSLGLAPPNDPEVPP